MPDPKKLPAMPALMIAGPGELRVDAGGEVVTLRSRSKQTPDSSGLFASSCNVPGGVPVRCSVRWDDREAEGDVERLSANIGRIEARPRAS
jgi:hypothetical protein